MKKVIISVILAIVFLCGCSGESNVLETKENKCEKEIFAMDTIMKVTIYGSNASEAMNKAVALIQRMDKVFSVTDKESDVAKINSSGGTPVTVSTETYELIQKSIEISKETGGLFDISVYPVVKAWGFTTENYQIPTDKQRKEALAKVDYRKIKLLAEHQVQLEAGMEIDLGAVAKGYLSQKLMELLQGEKVDSAIVSLGGNVQALGKKEDGSSFVVGITDPSDGSSLYGTIKVEDKAVITSGIYQRYFEKDGKKYHHIMDKRTGMPADNTLASVTVISEDGVKADALATALYVMGEGEAKIFQENHPEIQIILIFKDGTCWQSEQAGMTRNEYRSQKGDQGQNG